MKSAVEVCFRSRVGRASVKLPIALLAWALMLAGCGGSSRPSDNDPPPPPDSGTPPPPAAGLGDNLPFVSSASVTIDPEACTFDAFVSIAGTGPGEIRREASDMEPEITENYFGTTGAGFVFDESVGSGYSLIAEVPVPVSESISTTKITNSCYPETCPMGIYGPADLQDIVFGTEDSQFPVTLDDTGSAVISIFLNPD